MIARFINAQFIECDSTTVTFFYKKLLRVSQNVNIFEEYKNPFQTSMFPPLVKVYKKNVDFLDILLL